MVKANTQSMEVNLQNKVLTLQQLMDNTKAQMGGNFFIYSARNSNCQDFILNIVTANGLSTPENVTFIKQDALRIFGDLVYLRKFSNTLTDIAGRLNVIKEGAGTEIHAEPNHISLDNGLSNFDLEEILKGVKNFNGVYAKDRLPQPIKNGWYIINLQNFNDGEGTHWTCFKYSPKVIEYYDAFGFPPPIEVMKLAKGSINWSPKQIQNINSTACGWYCVARIKSKLSYQKFIDKFSTYTFKNDMILKSMLSKATVGRSP